MRSFHGIATLWGKKRRILKQIGVGFGAVENNLARGFVNFINENPIPLNMTVTHPFPFAVKRVIAVFGCKGFSLMSISIFFPELACFHTALLHQLVLLFERLGKSRDQHGLIVFAFFFKVILHIVKGAVSLCGNLAPHHGTVFLYRSYRLGVKAQFASLGIAMLGAKGGREQGHRIVASQFYRPKTRSFSP